MHAYKCICTEVVVRPWCRIGTVIKLKSNIILETSEPRRLELGRFQLKLITCDIWLAC